RHSWQRPEGRCLVDRCWGPRGLSCPAKSVAALSRSVHVQVELSARRLRLEGRRDGPRPAMDQRVSPVVLEQIDAALEAVQDLDWRSVDRHSFPLPQAAAFFDDVREELENGSGMVKLRGLDVRRYSQE